MRRLLRCCVFLVLSGSVLAAPDRIPFQDRLLRDVLADYEAAGYAFIYSNALVRPGLAVAREPADGEDLDRLRLALEELDLALTPGPRGQRWLIVRRVHPGPGLLTGRVIDAQSGEPLDGVLVTVGALTLVTRGDGVFRLAQRSEPVVVAAARTGYRPATTAAPGGADLLEVAMVREATIEEIVVTSSRYSVGRDLPVSARVLTGEEIDSLPELGDDTMRATLHLPGMSHIGLSAEPHVRGGARDETLVRFHNVELLEPFHLKDFQSVFSGLNPSLIRSVEVYTGGFPARYGDRMSGVMDIAPADDYPPLGGEVLLSFLTTAAAGYGTVDDGRGRWALSGRRGNLDLVTRQINPSVGDPAYSDWFGRFAWALTPATEVDVGWLVYDDDVEFKDLEDGSGELAHSRYRNTYGWVQLHHTLGRTASSTVLSFGDIRHRRTGFVDDPDLDEAVADVDDRRAFDVWRLAHWTTFTVDGDLELEWGVRAGYQTGDYRYRSTVNRGPLADLVGIPASFSRSVDARPAGWNGDAYGSARYQLNRRSTLEAGLRWDVQAFGDQNRGQLSPRLGLRIDVSESGSLRFAAGRYYQAQGIHELQVADGVDAYHRPQSADHFIVGYDHHVEDRLFLRVEAFGKRIRDPKPRFENLFDPLVLLPEVAADRVSVVPDRARVRGLETTVRYRPDPSLDVWLGYAFMSAEDHVSEGWRDRFWDQTHTVRSGVSWRNERWTVSGSLTWHSGWKTTSIPLSGDAVTPLELERNDATLDSYMSLDFRVSRRWTWPGQTLSVYLEATNLTNRNNVGGVDYQLDVDDGGGYRLLGEDQTLLPLVPSLGVHWQFR